MKNINQLTVPSIDAVDYNVKSKKGFFQRAYLSTEFLDKACEENCYYLIGEKGTGKTALAYHIQNSSRNNIGAKVISISETQYKRFIKLKEDGKLSYTDYSIIWRATLLYLISKLVLEKRKKWHHNISKKFRLIETAISKYDNSSQIPELEYVVEFVTTLTRKSELSATLPETAKAAIAEHGSQSSKTTQTNIKSALLESEGFLKIGLQDLKLQDDIVLFIDGLDAKPNGIEHNEYRNCLIGLSEAAWQLNSEFFPNIKDTKGRMRAVLLLRPDVFDSLNLHNSNCKLSDNSVVFHWHTTSERFPESNLFQMSDKYFTSQNENTHGWNHYFSEKEDRSKSFPAFLTNSFQRPRDVFSAIKILIDIYKRNGKGNVNQFARNSMSSAEFVDHFSDYLLGESKNYSNYYISNSDFEIYISFFQYLNGSKRFDYITFIEAFDTFRRDQRISELENNIYLKTPEKMLQFLYDINLIGYKETPEDGSGGFFHWAFRERSSSKIMPKVKVNCHYDVHPGIAKALNIGKKFRATHKS